MVNRVIIQGRFCADPKVEQKGGFDICEFTIAWSEKYKDKETKCFLRCKTWRDQAKFIEQHFTKGQEVVIEGKLATETWEKDGQTQSRIVCNVERINFCGSKSSDSKPSSDDGFAEPPKGDKEELPFE